MSSSSVFNIGSKLVLLNGIPMTLPIAASDPGSAVAGDMYFNSTSDVIRLFNGTAWVSQGSGTVTSVAASVPAFLSVSGSPITSSGTLAITLSGSALPISSGGTGQTTSAASFNALAPLTTTGDIIIEQSAGVAARLPIGSSGQVLTVVSGAPAWAAASVGTVTSVALADASTTPIFTISGSPVTSSGTLTLTLQTEAANFVFAGPSTGSAAQPSFRSLVAADIPSLSATYELVSNFASRSYQGSIALAASTSTATTIPALTFAFASFGSMKMDYVIIEASTSSRRMGSFRVATDGTNVGFSDEYAESAVIGTGLVLSAAISGSNIIIQFAGTDSNACTMRAEITQFAA